MGHNLAKRILLEQRSFWSGMAGLVVQGNLAKALNVPQPFGILVQQVAANSPSALIGLKPGTIPATIDGKALLVGGDILLSVLGMRIGDSSYEEIQERLSALPAGSLVRLTVLRDGRLVELSAPR